MIGYSKFDQVGKSKEKAKPKAIKPGDKTLEWNKVRDQLKVKFFSWGIVSCELGLDGCRKNDLLSFAHVDKRRNLLPDELDKVVLACIPCHVQVEKMPSKEMREKLEGIILRRITM